MTTNTNSLTRTTAPEGPNRRPLGDKVRNKVGVLAVTALTAVGGYGLINGMSKEMKQSGAPKVERVAPPQPRTDIDVDKWPDKVVTVEAGDGYRSIAAKANPEVFEGRTSNEGLGIQLTEEVDQRIEGLPQPGQQVLVPDRDPATPKAPADALPHDPNIHVK